MYYLYSQVYSERFRWGSQLHDIHIINLAVNVSIGLLTRAMAFAALCIVNRERLGRVSISRTLKKDTCAPLKKLLGGRRPLQPPELTEPGDF